MSRSIMWVVAVKTLQKTSHEETVLKILIYTCDFFAVSEMCGIVRLLVCYVGNVLNVFISEKIRLALCRLT